VLCGCASCVEQLRLPFIGGSPHRLPPARGRIILVGLLLAAARHEVVLVSGVFVLAFAAIELVGLLIPQPANGIVAIPTVDDVRAIASFIKHVIAASPVDDIIALAKIAMQ
jgi:hypothetical protein